MIRFEFQVLPDKILEEEEEEKEEVKCVHGALDRKERHREEVSLSLSLFLHRLHDEMFFLFLILFLIHPLASKVRNYGTCSDRTSLLRFPLLPAGRRNPMHFIFASFLISLR